MQVYHTLINYVHEHENLKQVLPSHLSMQLCELSILILQEQVHS